MNHLSPPPVCRRWSRWPSGALWAVLAVGHWACSSSRASGDSPDGDAGADVDGDVDADGDADAGASLDSGVDAAEEIAPFSFFATSLDTILAQSGSDDGFGGNLGGLSGADAICQNAATAEGFGGKTWLAFLSVTSGPGGGPIHAIDRIGEGPWYDRNGRLLAENREGLLQERPDGDPQIIDDLPDEHGQPLSVLGDSHDILTGSNERGELARDNPVSTCQDWTSASVSGSEERVPCGHSWPGRSGQHWIAAHNLRGCTAGINLQQNGPGDGDCVGCAGGYGAIYCFATTP